MSLMYNCAYLAERVQVVAGCLHILKRWVMLKQTKMYAYAISSTFRPPRNLQEVM